MCELRTLTVNRSFLTGAAPAGRAAAALGMARNVGRLGGHAVVVVLARRGGGRGGGRGRGRGGGDGGGGDGRNGGKAAQKKGPGKGKGGGGAGKEMRLRKSPWAGPPLDQVVTEVRPD
jgi:hypothetical protein